jgi:hypothetical protein
MSTLTNKIVQTLNLGPKENEKISVRAFCLLPPTNDEEWTLAVGCREFIYETDEYVICIKILQILKSNFQLSTNNPI